MRSAEQVDYYGDELLSHLTLLWHCPRGPWMWGRGFLPSQQPRFRIRLFGPLGRPNKFSNENPAFKIERRFFESIFNSVCVFLLRVNVSWLVGAGLSRLFSLEGRVGRKGRGGKGGGFGLARLGLGLSPPIKPPRPPIAHAGIRAHHPDSKLRSK